MRFLCLSLVFLGACTSHEVRCSTHLSPINLPGSSTAATETAVPLRPAPEHSAAKEADEVLR